MIIGITGSFGAGKGAVVDYLTQQKGFKHFSARQFIIDEIKRRDLPVNRDTTTIIANDLRAMHAPTYITEQLYKQAEAAGGNAVIESLRAVAEARFIKEVGGIVLGIDAPAEVRYDRIVARGTELDKVTFEQWLEQEKKETNPNDPTKQDIFGALKESDLILENDGTLDELHAKVDEFLAPHA